VNLRAVLELKRKAGLMICKAGNSSKVNTAILSQFQSHTIYAVVLVWNIYHRFF
jgi:hypothetical protein